MTMMTFQLCAYLSGFKYVERIKLNCFLWCAGDEAAEVDGGDRDPDSRAGQLLLLSRELDHLLQTKTKLKF